MVRAAVVFATDNPRNEARLISALKAIDGLEPVIKVLRFDWDEQAEHVFYRTSQCLPIMETRNRCQAHLQKLMHQLGCPGLVLDDDLVPQFDFRKWEVSLEKIRLCNPDMAFIQLTGDGPVPVEYMRAAPLLDIAFALRKHYPKQVNKELNEYLCRFTLGTHEPVPHSHHDLYAFCFNGFRPTPVSKKELERNLEKWLVAIQAGKTSTRSVQVVSGIQPATGRERGGATLFLNPEVLSVPNRALVIPCEPGGRPLYSRRSDMVMGIAARKAGFKSVIAPPLFEHCRNSEIPSSEPHKLIADILGAALADTLEHGSIDWQIVGRHFSTRLEKTRIVLRETDRLTRILCGNGVEVACNAGVVEETIANAVAKRIGTLDSPVCGWAAQPSSSVLPGFAEHGGAAVAAGLFGEVIGQ